ncbi:MAG: hypothetical protein ABH875_00430 [Candidatus Omnitrophota bacterium]
MNKILASITILLFAATSIYADWINPLELERGKTYILSRSTPISPKREIPESMEEMREIKKVPKRGKIRVVKVVAEEGETLYFVEGRTRKNRSVGRGWISSTSLTGQSLKKVAHRKKGTNKDAARLLSNIWGGDKTRRSSSERSVAE